MPELLDNPASAQPKSSHIFDFDLGAWSILAVAFLLRLWTAYGTFLNPDEALHYRVANKASLLLAYKFSLTTAHPPLLILFLYFWRKIGVSELVLRLPSIVAGTAFCWIVYQWCSRRFDRNTGWIGLIFAAFLPPLIALSAEVRQYAFLLFFIAAATYLLERALENNSVGLTVLSTVCLYLAMLTHYSALLFTAALGLYALLILSNRRPALRITVVWIGGQLGAALLFLFLYSSHISQLKANGAASSTIEGWMRNSFYHRGQDNPLLFIVARTFGVFQFVFGQLALGDIAFLVFIAAVVMLFRRATDKRESTALAVFLTVPFMLACVASMVGLYPYGGTRHSAFLALFAIAGVSFALSRVRWRSLTGRTLALTIVLLATAFGSPHRPYMRREDQSRAHMDAAIHALRQQAPPDAVLFVDPQTSLQFGHYLCEQKLTPRDTSTPGFESYYCGGFHVITPATNDMIFNVQRFFMEWDRMVHAFPLQEGETVYVVQAGWDTHLAQDLQGSGGFQALKPQFFGRNISFFNMAVGRSPAK